MTTQDEIKRLYDRIEYLEENRRFIQNAMESVLTLGHFKTSHEIQSNDIELLLERAGKKIRSIIDFPVWAFYLVDEDSFMFDLAYCYPPNVRDDIEKEVDSMIDQGMFAWAVRERRGVFIPSQDHSGRYLLHVISSDKQIKGMFVGALLLKRKHTVADTSLTLLSIILLRLASALEDIKFYQYMENQKEILEEKVAQRTKELTHSEAQLKRSTKKAHQLAQEAKRANEAKSDFLAKISHELRTPLNGIIGMIEVALSSDLDDNLRDILNTLESASHSLLVIINDILDFSKMEAGKLHLEETTYDLRAIVDEVADTFALQSSKKGIKFNTYLDPKMSVKLIGDPLRLRQVLLNLTGNALKFTEHGHIDIVCELESETGDSAKIKISVKDTGIGIPSEKQTKIFEGFSQADESTTRKYGGTGLGISISKQIVELMGGSLEVESRENHGSTFYFTLELKKQVLDEPVSSRKIFERALIVDDCIESRKILGNYLKSMGNSVVVRGKAKDALPLLKKENKKDSRFDVVFIGQAIERKTVLKLATDVRRIDSYRNLPIVAITSPEDAIQGLSKGQLGVDQCLPWPVKFNTLEAMLASLLDLSEPSAEASQIKDDTGVQKAPEESNRDDIRILLVDDYPINRKVASTHLMSAGYTVDMAKDGSQAVEAFGNTRYDVILMDIQMPVMDGHTAARTIREKEDAMGSSSANDNQRMLKRVPIIAMTAHAYIKDKEECLSAGMDDFISKPVRKKTLLDMVEKWISQDPQPPLAEVPNDVSAGQEEPMDFSTAVDEFGSREVVMEVAQQLVHNIDKQIGIMSYAIDNGDLAQLQKESHTIKGGAGTIEAHPLSALAKKLEDTSQEGNKGAVESMFVEFKQEFERLKAYVSTL